VTKHYVVTVWLGVDSSCGLVVSLAPAGVTTAASVSSQLSSRNSPLHRLSMAQPPQAKKRSFPGTQGAISSINANQHYIVKRPASDKRLLELILEGRYLLMHGHRMCGKSTRMLHLIENNTTLFRGLWCDTQCHILALTCAHQGDASGAYLRLTGGPCSR